MGGIGSAEVTAPLFAIDGRATSAGGHSKVLAWRIGQWVNVTGSALLDEWLVIAIKFVARPVVGAA